MRSRPLIYSIPLEILAEIKQHRETEEEEAVAS